jgi:hypothetical protein
MKIKNPIFAVLICEICSLRSFFNINTNILRKAFAILLLLFFLFNSMGYYFLFELNKFQVKKEMQSRSGKKSVKFCLLKIADPEKDLSFKRIHKKEIRFKNQMYDVIKEVKNKNVTLFYCLKDSKEDNLLSAMSKNAKTNYFLSLWGQIITIALPEYSIVLEDLCSEKITYYFFKSTLSSLKVAILSPPPEVS